MQPSDGEVTGVLAALPHGNADAEARLMELTYRELRRIANAYLRREREAVSVQASDSAPGLPPVAPLPPEHDVLQADRFLTFQARCGYFVPRRRHPACSTRLYQPCRAAMGGG